MTRSRGSSAISPHANGGSIAVAGEGGPCSNTGRKTEARRAEGFRNPLPKLSHDGKALSGALVDWLAFTVRPEGEEAEWLAQHPSSYVAHLCAEIFGASNIIVCEVEKRGRNGYTHTAQLKTANAACGFVALGGNDGTVNVQLPGTGCAAVACWFHVAMAPQKRAARITRVDLAYDDYRREFIDLDRWEAMARAGEIRAGNGPKPGWDVIDGHVSKTVYVGTKGAKELCVYEKGKQLGDKDSLWVRAEVRIWAKDRVIPYAVLTQCLSYLRAAYNVLSQLPGDVCERIKTTARSVAASAVAAVSWLRHAAGPLLHVLANALGEKRTSEILLGDVRRTSIPRRFAGISRDQLNMHLQAALCPF